jgi:hypothetical protein
MFVQTAGVYHARPNSLLAESPETRIDGAGPGGGGHRITNFNADEFRWYGYSPDGKTLAAVRNHPESDVVLLRESNTAAQ